MASTWRRTSTNVAYTLLLLAMSSTVAADLDLQPTTYKGCFAASNPLKNQGQYTYQSSGYCQKKCVKDGQAVLGLTGGNECWCGDKLPPASTKVDDSKCDTPCAGWPSASCGGSGYWTVSLTGTEDSVPNVDGSGTSDDTATATVAKPSVITSTSPNKTIIKTITPTAAGSSSGSSGGGGGGPNMAAVAAGVVVGVVLISAAIAGFFFWLRHRRRKASEEEFKRNQVVDFMRGGAGKPPQTGYSSMSDSRLDPEFGNKRNSIGSIADNEDFSRKILRVANPDRS